ncbi:adhesion G-protein coupled receptor F3 isoform X1 [Nycticebus coucang]|uniref:adhesion G-protein coupled receptor F3 isoform X1 n=3 Tax=Nycticebus coucang TaxID=9470 RepID=UPI00234C3169|nr:adhesion G-protein coupled receptor F3 isoform X1 [Nycticebus coucang]
MVSSAAHLLLLAMTFLLLGSPAAQESQPGQSPMGGDSEKLLDQESGAGAVPSAPVESALVSGYVRLNLSDNTWLLALSRTQTLPAALASASPKILTGLSLTTECKVNPEGHIDCACLSGYQWNATACSHHRPCQAPHTHQACGCLVLNHPEPGYCQLLPPVPGNLSLNSPLQMPGDTLNLTLLISQEATNLSWFLRPPGSSKLVLLQPGTQVSLTSSRDQAALSISNMSHHWAGEYMSCFEAQGFKWNLYQVVRVPLKVTDVTRLPDQLSISCATSPGFQLSCCIPSTDSAYTAAWSPREDSKASSFNTSGSQCFMLTIQRCPAADTTYTCDLQSQGLAPLRIPVSVTIIRDGDVTCPEDSSGITWNVTKAGHMAQAPCPMNKRGVVKRPCGLDGEWGPIHSSCTDERLLALFARAKLLRAGQGRPEAEVPPILRELSGLATGASSDSDLLALVGIMSCLAEVTTKARVQLDCSAIENLLTTTDKILDLNTSSLWTPAQAKKPWVGSTLLLAVETLARSLCPQDHPFTFSLPNVQLQTQLLGPTFPADYKVSFSTRPPLQAQIPRHSLAALHQNGTQVSITSLVLQKLVHLLPSNYGQGLGGSLYATPGLVLVISIVADGKTSTRGEVIMDFGHTKGTPHCVFWDHNLFQGKGGWSKEGCQAQAASASPNTQCSCQHLTAFSILMSRHAIPENPALTLLSQLGLGTSILALLMCLGVYRLVWRVVVRNKVAYFRHAALLNVVLCLLAADTCFLGAPLLPPGSRSPLCLAATFLCHFLYLATFFWMLAQALVLAHQLLFVFQQLSKHRVLPLMVLLGYLCPLGFAGVTLGLYLPRGQYLREGECWLDGKGGALYTFVGPVLAIVGVNGLVIAMAVLKLLRPSLSEGPPTEKRQALLGVIKALLVLTPIFGLTWGLGLATLLEEVSIVPHYIFTVLNTFQGVFILLFGCLMDKKVQEALRKRFCHTQPPNSTVSLATNESYILDYRKGGSKTASHEERMT